VVDQAGERVATAGLEQLFGLVAQALAGRLEDGSQEQRDRDRRADRLR
jgi:hypothetical protein